MNAENGGYCHTKGMEDNGKYDVPEDHQERSPLTGGSYIDDYGVKRFKCVELEVFKLE